MTTKTWDSLLDERCMTIYESPSGKLHVGVWGCFGMVLCGSFVDTHNGWRCRDLNSMGYITRLSQGNTDSMWCKRCLNDYRSLNVDL